MFHVHAQHIHRSLEFFSRFQARIYPLHPITPFVYPDPSLGNVAFTAILVGTPCRLLSPTLSGDPTSALIVVCRRLCRSRCFQVSVCVVRDYSFWIYPIPFPKPLRVRLQGVAISKVVPALSLYESEPIHYRQP